MRQHAKTQVQQWARTIHVRAPLLYLTLFVLVAIILLSIPYAHAEEFEPQAVAADATTETPLISLGGADTGVSAEELGENRARAMLEVDKVFVNDQELNGSVNGNSAINTYSGDNNIAGEAFGNATGFINSIQNTGNNVLIQSATIVNVSIED